MKKIFVFVVLAFVAGCGHKKEAAIVSPGSYEFDKKESQLLADVPEASPQKVEMKVIRSADTKFKVKDVAKASKSIDDIAKKFGGFISSSDLTSDLYRTNYVKLSRDSLLEVNEVAVTNNLVLRVPTEHFETVLNEFSKLHVFLDYRRVKSDDVSLIYFGNKLKAANKSKTDKRIQDAIQKKGKKLNDIIEAEQLSENLSNQAVDNEIYNLNIDAQVRYSTINIFLYQPYFIFKDVVPNNNAATYSPSFWDKLKSSVVFGWDIVLNIFFFIVKLWSLILIGIGIYFIVIYAKKYFKHNKKSTV